MPSDLPWFPLYVNDFASDGKVEAMTTEEVGAYFLLLCKAWNEKPCGSIPNDDVILARWARLDAARWSECKHHVLECFTSQADNRLHQKRMQRVYREVLDAKAKRSQAGRLGAERRWGDSNANGNAIAEAMPRQCDSVYDSESENQTSQRKKFVAPSLDEVRAYCLERGNKVVPEQFLDYYTANGWVQGRQGKPLRDWKAAVRTWERNGFQSGGKATPPAPPSMTREEAAAKTARTMQALNSRLPAEGAQ